MRNQSDMHQSGPADTASLREQASSRLFPPIWVWVVVAVALLAIVWLRWNNAPGDHAVTNILTLICAFIAFVAVYLWFLFFSSYAFWLRLTSLAALGLAIVGLSFLLEIYQVSGELVPSFRFRWSQSPDELLDLPEVGPNAGAADLLTTTPNDFPQFLGPDRNLRYDRIRLNPDWNTHPPELRWRHEIGAGWSAFAAVNGFAVTMEQRGEHELVTCYNVENGELVWAQSIKARHETVLGGVGPRSTPTIDSGRVYAQGATGVLRCLDGATGAVIWQEDLLRRYGSAPETDQKGVAWGRAGSPLVVDQLVVIPAGGPAGGPYVSLVAFNKETGELAWEAGDRQVSYASPRLATIAGIRQIVSVNENNVTAHDPADGRILWSFPWPGNSTAEASVSQPVVLPDDHVLLSKAYGGGASLLKITRSEDGKLAAEEIWHSERVLKTKFTNVVVYEDHVYGLSDGILECVTWATGRARWKRGRYGHGQVLGVRDLILVQAESGEVALVRASPRRYEELASFPALDGKTWNNLCLYGNRLLVRNAEEAACYELAVEDE